MAFSAVTFAPQQEASHSSGRRPGKMVEELRLGTRAQFISGRDLGVDPAIPGASFPTASEHVLGSWGRPVGAPEPVENWKGCAGLATGVSSGKDLPSTHGWPGRGPRGSVIKHMFSKCCTCHFLEGKQATSLRREDSCFVSLSPSLPLSLYPLPTIPVSVRISQPTSAFRLDSVERISGSGQDI